MYHSVSGGYHDDISLARFWNQIERFKAEYEIVDLTNMTETTDRPRIALTFDDGTTDFYENVRSILRECGVPATVFVVSNAILEEEFIHDYEYMTEKQFAELVAADLVAIGDHTESHPQLSELVGDELVVEIARSKEELEELLGIDVTRFCHSYGDYSQEAVVIVRSPTISRSLSRTKHTSTSCPIHTVYPG